MKTKDFIHALCAELDIYLASLLDSILHNPSFQNLNSLWEALLTLVMAKNKNSEILIKILSLNFSELKNDLNTGYESHLFDLIYKNEFDQAGGQPYSLLIINFSLDKSEPNLWNSLAKIAALAFFLCLIPGEEAELNQHKQTWFNFRKKPEAGFLGLFLGRILARNPYQMSSHKKIVYQESEDILVYKEGIWLYAELIIQSYLKYGWFYDLNKPIRTGISRLKKRNFPQTLCEKTYYPEKTHRLMEEGLICIQDQPLLNQLYFSSHQSLYANSEISGINNLGSALALSRFAHHLKVLMRDKLTLLGKEGCECYLQAWAQNYCSKLNPLAIEAELKYPLDEAKIKIIEQPDQKLICLMELKLKNLFMESIDTCLISYSACIIAN